MVTLWHSKGNYIKAEELAVAPEKRRLQHIKAKIEAEKVIAAHAKSQGGKP